MSKQLPRSYISQAKRFGKYHNIKVTCDGIEFDSKREAARYNELKLLQKAGEISDLVLQPEFILQVGFTDYSGKKQRPIIYRADFQYYDKRLKRIVVEDAKGMKTEKYLIKKKLFLYSYQDYYFLES